MTGDEIKAVQLGLSGFVQGRVAGGGHRRFRDVDQRYQMSFDLILLRKAATEAKPNGTPIAREAVDRVINTLK